VHLNNAVVLELTNKKYFSFENPSELFIESKVREDSLYGYCLLQSPGRGESASKDFSDTA
jgi:hypothetical protein